MGSTSRLWSTMTGGDRTDASAERSLEDRLAAYLSERLPSAEDVRVVDLERIFGGASRETYRFVLAVAQGTWQP